jgi:transcriptional regulator with XRE-family HTH domain
MVQEERTNNLVQYRKRMKLTQPEVARLLGWKNIKGLCELEAGRAIPTLITAFKLSIIYRIPIEFLYREFYERLRKQIRMKEVAVSPAGHQPLPLNYADYLHS